MPWRQLEFRCTCGAITLLPPAPPLVVRVEQPCRLQFTLHSEEQATLAVALNSFRNQFNGIKDVHLLMALSVVTMIPCIVLFFVAR